MLTKRSLAILPLLVATLYLAPAPQAAQAGGAADVGNAIVDYLGNTIVDIFDIVEVGVTVGNGFGLDARATCLADIGYSEQEATRYGWNDRDDDAHVYQLFGAQDVSNSDKGISVAGLELRYAENSHDPYEVGATAHAFAGVDVSANIRSVFDVLTGLVMIDLEDDNVSYNLFGGGDDDGE